jgi:NarL family two-component system response regulator LiaR
MAQGRSSSMASPKKSNRITILVADDHPLLRQAVKGALQKEADFEVVAEAGDGNEAVRLARELVPDVVIMDIGMPNLDGLEATRQIKATHPNIAILALTVHDEDEYILGILEAGAAGYILKTIFGAELIAAVRAVIAGEMVLSLSIAPRLMRHAVCRPTKPVLLEAGEKLAVRELEVLRLAAQGMSNKDIALELKLSLRTVKGYLAEIFSKLRVGSRTEAVITALKAGILSLDDLEEEKSLGRS